MRAGEHGDGQMRRTEPGVSTRPARGRPDHTAAMTTGLLLWLCSLPLVGLLILPWFGTRVALIVAAALLAVAVTACYGLCAWQVAGPKRGGDDE